MNKGKKLSGCEKHVAEKILFLMLITLSQNELGNTLVDMH